MFRVDILLLLLGMPIVAIAAPSCDIAGAWVLRGRVTPSRTQTYVATDHSGDPGVDFNVNWDIRHGPEGGNGTYVGANGLSVQVIVYNGTTQQKEVKIQTGTFSPNCTAITWEAPWDDHQTTSGVWCKAWTVGCSPEPNPPYGLTMSFFQTLGDNMVLQRAPAKAAVYGVYGPVGAPKDAKIAVTVVNNDGGTSYTVDAELNTVHQARADPDYVACTECPGPYATWKALLPPTAAGGNYTIMADCTGCGGDPKYWHASITNVTFGDGEWLRATAPRRRARSMFILTHHPPVFCFRSLSLAL